MSSPSEPADRSSLKSGISARFRQILIFFILQGVLLFGCAGTAHWIWAWVYLAISFVVVAVNGTVMLKRSPETIAERGKPGEMKQWDKIVSFSYSVAFFLLIPSVAGLDARFGWTGDMAAGWHFAGAVALILGYGLAGWAMIANAFFSSVARIQRERGHTVCHTGPYKFVRHPGYAGFILQSFANAFLLGSLWALIPSVLSATVLIVRTSLEDRMLREELTGYADYANEVRYRIIPGLW